MAQQALGMIETRGMVALVEAADAALKAANVTYRGWKQVGSALCTVLFEGDVSGQRLDETAAISRQRGRARPYGGDLELHRPALDGDRTDG